MAKTDGGPRKSDALHLDDFSVKQQPNHQTVPKYYGEALLAAARTDSSILALTADLTAPTETDLVCVTTCLTSLLWSALPRRIWLA